MARLVGGGRRGAVRPVAWPVEGSAQGPESVHAPWGHWQGTEGYWYTAPLTAL